MGAILIMVVILTLLIGLTLVLSAKLYCSLLCRPRKLQKEKNLNTAATNSATATATVTTKQNTSTTVDDSLNNFYTPGVLQAPRNLLFPAVSSTENIDLEKQYSSLQSPIRFTPFASPKVVQEWSSTCSYKEQEFIYICNPMYDNVTINRASMSPTPFETPVTSPSRLDAAHECLAENDQVLTPPLTPMKKLPAEACSVALRDARSLSTSGSDSNNNKDGVSLSSSASPRTSPSW